MLNFCGIGASVIFPLTSGISTFTTIFDFVFYSCVLLRRKFRRLLWFWSKWEISRHFIDKYTLETKKKKIIVKLDKLRLIALFILYKLDISSCHFTKYRYSMYKIVVGFCVPYTQTDVHRIDSWCVKLSLDYGNAVTRISLRSVAASTCVRV